MLQPSGVGPGSPQTAARRRGVDRLAAFILTHAARSLSCPRSGPFAAAHHGVRALSCEFTLAIQEQCRAALANCNETVIAHATVHEYRRCATASLARDDCGAAFLELQVRHRDFESAVAERQAKCGTDQ